MVRLVPASKNKSKYSRYRLPRKYVGPAVFAGLIAIIGVVMIWRSFAATGTVAIEAEAGTVSGAASTLTALTGASGNAAVKFGAAGNSNEVPTLTAQVLFEGKAKIWDLDFLPDNSILFNERKGVMSIYTGGTTRELATMPDVYTENESGLMGITVDPQFATNRYVYACYSTTAGDAKVARWVLAADNSSLGSRKDIVTGITNGPIGRHGGCRIRFGTDGYLWIGTGDAQIAGSPQNKTSLNGKILRVDREGAAAPGNLGNGFDARIYSHGHRNVQGIAFFPSPRNGVPGVSVEHGSTVDDEVNLLNAGNFGWAPDGGSYSEEGVPMTDTDQFPEAIEAIWSSGSPTQAPSGATVLNGPQWKAWNGAVAVGIMKAMHLKILQLDASNNVADETNLYQDTYGRIRTPRLGLDGNLYITTDNDDNNDKIIKLTPQ